MARQREKTLAITSDRVFLMVGVGSVLEEQCARVAREIGGIPNATPVPELHKRAARWRPFAIVMPDRIYAGDPEEYEALAQDVGGHIIAVPKGGVTGVELRRQLTLALNDATARRG